MRGALELALEIECSGCGEYREALTLAESKSLTAADEIARYKATIISLRRRVSDSSEELASTRATFAKTLTKLPTLQKGSPILRSALVSTDSPSHPSESDIRLVSVKVNESDVKLHISVDRPKFGRHWWKVRSPHNSQIRILN